MTYSVKGVTVVDINRNVTVASANVFGNVGYPLNNDLFQGLVAGYTSGGQSTPPTVNVIDKFPFSTDANAADVGDLSRLSRTASGQSSSVSGYTSGGIDPPTGAHNIIDKFPFATNANATDVGDLTQPGFYVTGQSSSTSGYRSGGQWPPGFNPTTGNNVNIIDKFPFASNANATDVGDLTLQRWGSSGQSSTESGYHSGGGSYVPTTPQTNIIDKFPFSTNANATDVGDLTSGESLSTGQSSTVSGYVSGQSGVIAAAIEKFPFATDTNATLVGSLISSGGTRNSPAGQSSSLAGYASGGDIPSVGATPSNTIDKFPFATDSNSTDVGDLTVTRRMAAGQQD